MKITCLRCNAELKSYLMTQLSFLPYDVSHSHAMLECHQCGHLEFLSKNSPMLKELEMIPSLVGDGD